MGLKPGPTASVHRPLRDAIETAPSPASIPGRRRDAEIPFPLCYAGRNGWPCRLGRRRFSIRHASHVLTIPHQNGDAISGFRSDLETTRRPGLRIERSFASPLRRARSQGGGAAKSADQPPGQFPAIGPLKVVLDHQSQSGRASRPAPSRNHGSVPPSIPRSAFFSAPNLYSPEGLAGLARIRTC